MMIDKELEAIVDEVFDSAFHKLSDIKPSDWAEQNRFMPQGPTTMPGMYRFENAPYSKEILNHIDPNSAVKTVTVMKGSQLGLSTGVVENAIGYLISHYPANIMLLVGTAALVADSMKKIDLMIDNSGIRDLIKSSVQRKRSTKSGDTDARKDFEGGDLKLDTSNHKNLRNISVKVMLVDDYDAMKGETKESGDTLSMIKARQKAFSKDKKLYLISSPELEETSNIYKAYLKGDQRKWHIPCPCCGVKITWEWEVSSKKNETEKAGITWKLDEDSKLIPGSVGYTCQECGEFFDNKNKSEMINAGEFIPTCPENHDPEYVSYHISALYAPIYMDGWLQYVKEYLEANPPGEKRNEAKHATFVNQCLGFPYTPVSQSVTPGLLQNNIRNYEIGVIPETLSIRDGNGEIVMLTLGSDMNGTEDDARLDWEVVAWSENGNSYSVEHGSIGTFIPKENQLNYKPDREKWTYRKGYERSVWDELDRLMERIFETDTGRKMQVFVGALDAGHSPNEVTREKTTYAYDYVDTTRFNILAIKGDKDQTSGIQIYADYKPFTASKERGKNLWMLNVNYMKDLLATDMGLIWNERMNSIQPIGFMNFPIPSGGRYLKNNYFDHFEAEHKVIGKNNRFIWQKKKSGLQNHLFDCRLYAIAAREIMMHKIFEEYKVKNGTWSDFSRMLMGS